MAPMPLRLIALGHLLGELGREVQEAGDSNWSPRIEEYFLNLDPPIRLFDTDGDGVKEGYPYCAATIQFATDGAAERYGVVNPLDDVKREAYVQDYYDLAVERDWLISIEEVEAGDLLMFRFGANPTRWNHIGMVFAPPYGGDTIRTVEGNTSPPDNLAGDGESEREGNGLWAKDRALSSYPERLCVARWDEGIIIENP